MRFPLPGSAPPTVAAPAPGAGPGYWSGASCAVLDRDGTYVLAYRVRNGHDGIDQTAIARSWRGWRLPEAGRAFEGDGVTAVKDPIVRLVDGRWEAWICGHALDVPGAEDRISSAYATSDDGLRWRWHGTVLGGRPGLWDGSCRICYEARLPDESHQLRTELIPRS